MPNGYDWDLYCNKAVKEQLYVQDGEFCFPSGMRYQLLVLPEMESVSLDLLKAQSLVGQGGHVMVRSRPERATG